VTEQINILEGKLQQAANENVKLKVKQNEHSKLWEGLDSKISSTKSLWQLKKPLAENHKFCHGLQASLLMILYCAARIAWKDFEARIR
jgi:hypothetical protein